MMDIEIATVSVLLIDNRASIVTPACSVAFQS